MVSSPDLFVLGRGRGLDRARCRAPWTFQARIHTIGVWYGLVMFGHVWSLKMGDTYVTNQFQWETYGRRMEKDDTQPNKQ